MSEAKFKSTRTVQAPIFSRKKTQFGIWYPRFKTYSVTKGISEALYSDFDLSSDPNAVPTVEADKKEHMSKLAKNTSAAVVLILAFITVPLLDIIISTKTTEYPGGITHLAIKKLFRKYPLQDNISNVEAESKLSRL